jgi:hypothetical protein
MNDCVLQKFIHIRNLFSDKKNSMLNAVRLNFLRLRNYIFKKKRLFVSNSLKIKKREKMFLKLLLNSYRNKLLKT